MRAQEAQISWPSTMFPSSCGDAEVSTRSVPPHPMHLNHSRDFKFIPSGNSLQQRIARQRAPERLSPRNLHSSRNNAESEKCSSLFRPWIRNQLSEVRCCTAINPRYWQRSQPPLPLPKGVSFARMVLQSIAGKERPVRSKAIHKQRIAITPT